MKLTINGTIRDAFASTLEELLSELEYEGDWLATALNGELVHRGDRPQCQLAEGDRIEILSPMKGG
ncbi:sulfur carrier protein ThiS [Pseudaminobacter arsenicus]|uniref:Sulfur carrier protein ThiS n=1 Tax=Borborobacter arsenicus TaxID=1851146 RepID=A0A432V2B9_9HYPH|nr:sulfur carrier protein ThiS [Pseudaminobacter arsenicus]RUM96311.1 sulfur carrier protein ThiS [Pseudaminobacter arsenicus]